MADEYAVTGGRELDAFLQQLSTKVEKNIMRAALRAGAAVIRDEARNNVSVLDGLLRRSIRVSGRAKNGTVTASVKVGAFYGLMIEYGVKPHLIKVQEEEKAINYRLTRKRGTLTRVSMRTVNRHVLQIGNHFVGPVVSHPGFSEKPFLRPALDTKAGAAIEAVKDKIRQRLTKEGLNVPAPEPEDS
nr:HK97-gp10 family putative phage morphogenesis protein [uncultured Massilia sp.]